jgi:hypothetical protein
MSVAITETTVSEDHELVAARKLLDATLVAARKTDSALKTQPVAEVVVDVPAPYAREKRLILGSLAHAGHVLAVGTARFAPDEYRRGAEVTLIGYTSHVELVTATYETRLDEAFAAMTDVAPRAGEDVATFRSSFLLGFRQGLRDGGLSREQVEAAVATPDTEQGVYMRSTGSGAWAGYQAVTQHAGEALPEPAEMTDEQLAEADAAMTAAHEASDAHSLTDQHRAVKAELGRRTAEQDRKEARSRAAKKANAPAGGWTEADRVA